MNNPPESGLEQSLETLFEREPAEGAGRLSDELRARYGGDLGFPAPPPERPLVIANFVSTLDGVVSFDIAGNSGGAPVSGANPGDRFIMGLLRASADAVIVGAGTVAAASRDHLWSADYIYPPAGNLYTQYRRQTLAKGMHPMVVIVSGTGRIDLSRAVFHTPGITALLITTETGRLTLTEAGAGALSSTILRPLPAKDGGITASAILALLKREFGAGLVLHEGGPTLLGQFLVEKMVDELFLTLAPQIAGRAASHFRPALIMGTEFLPQSAPWLDLLAVKRGGDHLYLRYRFRGLGGKLAG